MVVFIFEVLHFDERRTNIFSFVYVASLGYFRRNLVQSVIRNNLNLNM